MLAYPLEPVGESPPLRPRSPPDHHDTTPRTGRASTARAGRRKHIDVPMDHRRPSTCSIGGTLRRCFARLGDSRLATAEDACAQRGGYMQIQASGEGSDDSVAGRSHTGAQRAGITEVRVSAPLATAVVGRRFGAWGAPGSDDACAGAERPLSARCRSASVAFRLDSPAMSGEVDQFPGLHAPFFKTQSDCQRELESVGVGDQGDAKMGWLLYHHGQAIVHTRRRRSAPGQPQAPERMLTARCSLVLLPPRCCPRAGGHLICLYLHGICFPIDSSHASVTVNGMNHSGLIE